MAAKMATMPPTIRKCKYTCINFINFITFITINHHYIVLCLLGLSISYHQPKIALPTSTLKPYDSFFNKPKHAFQQLTLNSINSFSFTRLLTTNLKMHSNHHLITSRTHPLPTQFFYPPTTS